MKIIAQNKKASFNFEVIDEIVAGIKLEGREIKSLRTQKPSFVGSFVTVSGGKAFLHDLNIPRYKYDSQGEYMPKRKRILLLKKAEIDRLEGKMSQEGVTVVPLAIGFDRQWAKVKIGLVRGKKLRDKRQKIMEREDKVRVGRMLKNYR